MPLMNDQQAQEAVRDYLAPAEKKSAPVSNMRPSLSVALDTDPDKAAELKRISDETGVPFAVLNNEENAAKVKKRAAMERFDFDMYGQMFPNSAKFFADPDLAKLGHDDLETTGIFEHTLGLLGQRAQKQALNTGTALGVGAGFSLPAGLWGVFEEGAALTSQYVTAPIDEALYQVGGRRGGFDVFDDLQGFFEQRRKASQKAGADLLQPALEEAGFIEKGFYSGMQSIGLNLPGVLASVITRNPNFALGMMGATSFGTSAGRGLDEGLDPLAAGIYGMTDAVVEVGTERLPLDRFIGDLSAGSSVLKTIFGQLATEVPGELIATTLQNFNEWATLNNDEPFQTYIDALPADLAQTLIATVAAVGVQQGSITLGAKAVDKLRGREQAAQDAEADAKVLEKIAELAGASKILQRAPETFEQLVEQMADGAPVTDVYIDPEELKQSGIDLEALAALSPSVRKQKNIAENTGGLVRIPVAEYASTLAASEFGQPLIDVLRTDPHGMSRMEAAEFMKNAAQELEDEVEKNLGEAIRQTEKSASRQKVEQVVLDQLTSANRFTADVNRPYASLLGHFYETMGERTGRSAEEFFAAHPVRIQAESAAGEAFNQSAPSFISPAKQAVQAIKQEKGTGEQFLAQIRKTAGVKEEELAWTGLDEFLKGKASVTKQEVLDYIEQNTAQVEEVTLGTKRAKFIVQNDETGYTKGEYENEEQARAEAERMTDSTGQTHGVYSGEDGYYGEDATKFSQYTLPGGENYREVLLTLPQKPNTQTFDEWLAVKGIKTTGDVSRNSDLMRQWDAEMQEEAGDFRSPHFDQPNIIAHLRLNDRVDADGKKVLFIEEIQSDWHQAGRKKGYRTGKPTGLRIKDSSTFGRDFFEITDENGVFVTNIVKYKVEEAGLEFNEESALKLAQERVDTGQIPGYQREAVPDAPLKKTWHEMAFRRAVQMAAEGGYDRVAWTTGVQQNERFDLSRQVEKIAVPMVNKGSRSVRVDALNGQSFNMMVDDNGVVQGFYSAAQFNGKTLDEVVGKDMADKIMKLQEPAEFSGEGLSVGGEGMKGFYDKIIPAYANKFGKKYGAKVSNAQVGTSGSKSFEDYKAEIIENFGPASDEDIRKSYDNIGFGRFSGQQVHALDITDSMRESVVQGVPLFQGNRGSFNPQNSTITLLNAADLSTFLHEAGHFFLETLAEVAAQSNAPQEVRDDMDRVLKFIEIPDLGTWQGMTLDQQRDAHEKFARAFEAYLFEGKAPSVELQTIFQRFRDWLIRIYREIRNLNVELNEDIRRVFDRMLATDEVIREAEAARGMLPLFTDAAQAGMTEDEWTAYQTLGAEATAQAATDLDARSLRDMQWLRNARSKHLKRLQKDARAKRAQVRAEVEGEVLSKPVHQAYLFITRGEYVLPEDANKKTRRVALEIAEGSTTTKLSLPTIKAFYGENDSFPDTLPKGRHGLVANEGLDFDFVADMFGYTSGDQMLKELVAREDPTEEIEALTDRRMLERYGDISDPASLEKAADAATHNDARARFVATEMAALQKATGGKKILAQAAKDFASAIINRLKIRDVKPSRYTAAEARAARKADKARKAGDLQTAAAEKRNQLVQLYAAKAASEALAENEKNLKYLRKFDKTGTRDSIDRDYLDQIDAILERFDLRKSTSLRALAKRKSLAEWIAAQEELGIEPDIPDDILNHLYKKSYKDMTVGEMRALVDTIKQIEHLGRLKNKLLTLKDQRQFNAVVEDVVESIYENAKTDQVDNTIRATKGYRVKALFKGYLAQHRKLASLVRVLDGVKDGGALWEAFIRTMNEAGDKETVMREQAAEKLLEISNDVRKLGKMGGKGEFFPTLNRSLNREERLAVVLNMGNEGNMQRLLDGNKWSREDVQPVIDSLTPEEAAFVQEIWDLFESYRPQIAAKERRIYGKEPEWIEPVPLDTPHGTLRGGYYPIRYDTRRSAVAAQHSDAETAKQQLKGAYTTATTRRSFVKTRAAEVRDRPVLLTMDALYGGMNEVIHDLAWHEWLIDANRLLRSKRLSQAVLETQGADTLKQMKDAVKDIAGGDLPTGGAFEKISAHFRAGATVAGLGLNVVTAFINTTGITQSMVRIGPRWVAQGVGRWVSGPVSMVEEIYGKSPFMRLRGKTMLREINEIQNLLQDKSQVRAAMDQIAFLPLRYTQLAIDGPTWWGAYQKALAEGNEDARAVALADQAVIDAQGSGMVKDLAAIQRGGPLLKLWTTFYSYFSTTYQLTVEQTSKTNFKDPLDVVRLAGDYFLLYVVPAALGALIRGAVSGDDEPEEYAQRYANEQLSYLVGPLVGLRESTYALQKALGVNKFHGGYSGPAGIRFLQELDNLGEQIGQGELDRALLRSLVNVTGITLRIPSSQVNKTIDGMIAMMDGDTYNPTALVFGPPKN